MNLYDEQKIVQKAMNTTLSGLQEDPWLARRVLANTKEEKPVQGKRKISLALSLSIILGVAVIGTACALFSSQVVDFFGQYWNRDDVHWLQGGKIAQIGETVTVDNIDFTLDEVVYRSRRIYGVGTARAKDSKDVLLSMDETDNWNTEAVSRSEEAQALIHQAQEAGGQMLSVECYPKRIGVDHGSMVNTEYAGVYNTRNKDGSITFSFETGGYALEEGATYQLELRINVDAWTESGKTENDSLKPQTWTISFEPVFLQETIKPENPVQSFPDTIQQSGYEILVPASYQETGTLPVYRAFENDFTALVQPKWFNRTGIEKESREQNINLTFRDHAELSVSPNAICYAEYTEDLFDYNGRERETSSQDPEPMMLPRQALSQGIANTAAGVCFGLDYSTGVSLERDQLALISLKQAKQAAEDLFNKLGLQGYELAWALDMSLDRIQTLGEAYNRFWFEGEAVTNEPKQDFSTATVEDEGYLLIYSPLGVLNVSDGRHQITLFVNSRGIAQANIVSSYKQGDVAYTPEKLISADEAVKRLDAEIAQSYDGKAVRSIERIALTYGAVRAENKQDGMVFVPVWQILYKEAVEENEDTLWAEINAVNGTLINAIFR